MKKFLSFLFIFILLPINSEAIDRIIRPPTLSPAEIAAADATLSNQITVAFTAADTIISNDVTTAFQSADAAISNQLISLSGLTMAVNSGDWYGWEADEGSTTNNAVVFTGYSTPNATNNGNSGWGWYSAETVLQDKYAYAFAAAPATASGIGGTGIVVLVRSSSTGITTNKIGISFDDGSTVVQIGNMVSDTADEWKQFSIVGVNLPAAWTSNVPAVTQDGVVLRGLNVRIDAFSSYTNYISVKVLIDWD